MPKNIYSGVDSDAVSFIKRKAKKLTRLPFFTPNDYEDLSQELMLAYLHAWPKFDPAKGNQQSFVKTVVNNCARNLVLAAERQKHWMGQKELSLSSLISEEGNLERVDSISNEQHLFADPLSSQSHDAIDQQIDIHKWLATLPNDLLETYELLKDYSITEASLKTGVPRTTLSSRLKRLRKHLVEEFLKK